jgi:hypothetical protein
MRASGLIDRGRLQGSPRNPDDPRGGGQRGPSGGPRQGPDATGIEERVALALESLAAKRPGTPPGLARTCDDASSVPAGEPSQRPVKAVVAFGGGRPLDYPRGGVGHAGPRWHLRETKPVVAWPEIDTTPFVHWGREPTSEGPGAALRCGATPLLGPCACRDPMSRGTSSAEGRAPGPSPPLGHACGDHRPGRPPARNLVGPVAPLNEPWVSRTVGRSEHDERRGGPGPDFPWPIIRGGSRAG